MRKEAIAFLAMLAFCLALPLCYADTMYALYNPNEVGGDNSTEDFVFTGTASVNTQTHLDISSPTGFMNATQKINSSGKHLLAIINFTHRNDGAGNYYANTYREGAEYGIEYVWNGFLGKYQKNGVAYGTAHLIANGVTATISMYFNDTINQCGQTEGFSMDCSATGFSDYFAPGFGEIGTAGKNSTIWYFAFCDDTDNDFKCTIPVVTANFSISAYAESPSGVLYPLGTGLVKNLSFEAGTWQFLSNITGDNITYVNHSVRNNSQEIYRIQANASNVYAINLSSAYFVDFSASLYNWSVLAMNPLNVSNSSLFRFNFTDVVNPSCLFASQYNFTNGTVNQINVSCSDENFFSLNVSCDNANYSYYVEGLNVKAYVANISINVTSNGSCNLEWCDAHTAEAIADVGAFNELGKLHFSRFGTSLEYEGSPVVKTSMKRDRLSFSLDYSASPKSEYSFVYHTSGRGYYLKSSLYPAWVADPLSKSWFDLKGAKGSVEVTDLMNGDFGIVLNTIEKNLVFDSVGEFNCVLGAYNVSATIPGVAGVSVPSNYSFNVSVCPASSLAGVGMSAVYLIVILAIILMGFLISNALGCIGGLGMVMLGMYFGKCDSLISPIISISGLLVIIYFIFARPILQDSS